MQFWGLLGRASVHRCPFRVLCVLGVWSLLAILLVVEGLMVRLFHRFRRLWVVRVLSLGLERVGVLLSRLWGHLRFQALVPGAGQSVCHWTTEIKYGENIVVGDYVAIGPHCCLGARSRIEIGDHVRISRGVVLETAGLDLSGEPPYQHHSSPIVIEEGVWLASGVIVLGGVRVGRDSIIGAGVVVSKDVPAGSVMVGGRNRFLERKIER